MTEMSKACLQIFGWMLFVTGSITLLTGAPEPFVGAVIAALLFVPPFIWVEQRAGRHADNG